MLCYKSKKKAAKNYQTPKLSFVGPCHLFLKPLSSPGPVKIYIIHCMMTKGGEIVRHLSIGWFNIMQSSNDPKYLALTSLSPAPSKPSQISITLCQYQKYHEYHPQHYLQQCSITIILNISNITIISFLSQSKQFYQCFQYKIFPHISFDQYHNHVVIMNDNHANHDKDDDDDDEKN